MKNLYAFLIRLYLERNRFLILILLHCLVIASLLSQEVSANDKKNILILNSYHQGYKWTDDETKGAIAALEPDKKNIKLFIEYMGAKWINDEQYILQLSELYRQKFHKMKFDVIIATDNDAFDFLRLYRNKVFGNVPVVFCGVNWFKDEDLLGQTLFTGVNEDADIVLTVDLMLKLHPGTKNIYVVIDSTTTGLIIHKKIIELIPLYKDRVSFILLEKMDMESIIYTVANAPENSLILHTIFQKDINGTFFEFSESTNMISINSVKPVYGLWDFNLGFGITGGMLTSGYSQGNSAGSLALRIIRGESPESIPVIKKSPNKYMFDFLQIKRFGINRSSLPNGSIVINEQELFYSINRKLVLGYLAGFIALFGIVALLLINIRKRVQAQTKLNEVIDKLEMRVKERTADLEKINEFLMDEINERKKAQKIMNESEERFKALHNASFGGISIHEKGIILDCNQGLADLTGYSINELIGMNGLELIERDMRDLVMEKIITGYEQPYEIKGRRKDGTQYNLRIQAKNIPYHGRTVRVTEFRDITEQKLAEDKIKSLLLEKEIILREVHHRIKNNMNVINGLLVLQADTLKDPIAVKALEDAGSRIQSMMILYNKLYSSSDVQNVSVNDYFSSLIDEILDNFPDSKTVKVEKKIDDFILHAKKIQPLAIIVNEILTNIMKYAFTDVTDRMIKVSAGVYTDLKQNKESLASIIIQDNGNGMPESVDFENSAGFGLQLVSMLTKELHGTIRIERGKGTKIILEFAI